MFYLSSIKFRISVIILFFALISLINAYIHLSSVKRSQTLFEENKQHQLNAYTLAHDIQNQLQKISIFKQPLNADPKILEQSTQTLQVRIDQLAPYFENTDYESTLNDFYNQSMEFNTQITPFLEDLVHLDSNNSSSLFNQLKKQGAQLSYTSHDFQSIELINTLLLINEELVLAQRASRKQIEFTNLKNALNQLNTLIESPTNKYSAELLTEIKTYNASLTEQADAFIKTRNGLKKLITTANEFHTFLTTRNVSTLVEDIYLLRVFENEILSEYNLSYFDKVSLSNFDQYQTMIIKRINDSKIDDKNKILLQSMLESYIDKLSQIKVIAKKIEAQKTDLSQLHRKLFDNNTQVFDLLPKVFLNENSKIANSTKQESFLIACIYLLIAICIFIVFWMAINNRILEPLKSLQKAAKRYGEGEREVDLEIHTKDELGLLAKTFNDMTSQLDTKNDQLVESLEAITLQDENKRNFVAMISHEIRTPLNGIIGMSYLAQQSNTDLKVQSYLDSIFRSSNSLLGIINDLMDFSKIESSKFDINPVTSNLTETLDQVCATVGLYAEGKNLPFLLEVDTNIPQILSFDSLRLQQVLINLSNNSIKFTQTGQVLIQVYRLNGKDVKNAKLRFSIIDTGPGLSKKQIASIFTPFEQADNSITRRFGGTGLGLSISQEIINLMGSEIKINSTVSVGSEFYFDLDLPIAQDPEEFQFGTYLLLSNDDTYKANIQNNLCKQDILLHAKNYKKAKQSMSDTHFDYIILDWQCISESLDERKLIVEALQKTSARILVMSFIQEATSLKNFCKSLISQYPKRLILSNKPFIRAHITHPNWENTSIKIAEFDNQSIVIKGKVLVVEDDLINQQVMIELLKSFGLDVFVADNGREAITMAKKLSPEVILMDIEMAGMDGYQTSHELRQDSQFDNTPIIALSGHDIRNNPKFKQAKFDDALLKPIDPTALHRLLQSNLMQQLNEQKLVHFSKMDDLALLTTFDYNSGLKRVAGEKQLYVNLIKEFHGHFSDAKLVLDMLVQAGDFEPASKYCHRLKGVAANLGNSKLQNSLHDLELQLKSGAPKKESLQEFEQCFTESISEINLFLQTQPKAHSTPSSKTITGKDEIFNGLFRYIENADGEIIDYFHEHKNTFKQMLDPRDFDQLDDAINHFNFAKAATILNSQVK